MHSCSLTTRRYCTGTMPTATEGQLNFNAAAHVEELGNLFSDMREHASVPEDLSSLII